jgi:hypothetical protein
MTQHIVQWATPSPLWSELITNGSTRPVEGFGAPAILRFATDDFMQKYQDTLSTDPLKLGEFRAVPETWRGALAQPKVPTAARSFALSYQRRGSINARTSSTGAKATSSSDAAELPRLKLYQPAHQRYYLISACLVCASPGLPDRKVDGGKQEKISFVMRRLIKPTNGSSDATQWPEYAWVDSGTGYVWQKVRGDDDTSDAVTVTNEERLPLFSTTFHEDDLRSRRLVSGIIPVAKREAYLGAQSRTSADASATNGTTAITARKILLRKQVIEPWKALVTQMASGGAANSTIVNSDGSTGIFSSNLTRDSVRSAREQAQLISWLILSDFAEFLSLHIPELWESILAGTRPAGGFPNMGKVYDALDAASWSSTAETALLNEYPDPTHSNALQSLGYPPLPASLRLALTQFGQGTGGLNTALRSSLDRIDQPYSRKPGDDRSAWPGFLFPLTDPDPSFDALLPLLTLNPAAADPDETSELLIDLEPTPNAALEQLDTFAVLLVRALAESKRNTSAPQPDIPAAAIKPADPSTAIFRIRCVYERPACGPLHEDVVSDPTEPFELAGFFDPDAPARPIRIGLPIDTTPAGLRKFDKNTAFIMSDILCGQVQRMKGLGFIDLVLSVLPWPFHKDLSVGDMKPCGSTGGNFGMICSLSIPIITICALILLMIIVALLDFVFRWLPFFIICFPIPGLKAKKS